MQAVFRDEGAGRYVVITPNQNYTMYAHDAHSQPMIEDFGNSEEKLQKFAALLEDNPLNAFNLYNGIPVEPSK